MIELKKYVNVGGTLCVEKVMLRCRECGEEEKIVMVPHKKLVECGVCGRKFPFKSNGNGANQ